MTYRTYHLGLFVIAAAGLTTATLFGIALFGESHALYDFFFHRSQIQWLTLGIFYFILSVLGHRVVSQVHLNHYLKSLAVSHRGRDGGMSGSGWDHFEKVRVCKKVNGPRAAAEYSRELAEQAQETTERVYRLLGHATQALLAAGFFGTIWGISQSMLGSFGNLAGATTAGLKTALGKFTGDLGTALDTTVLAIVCSLIASALMTVMQWVETNGGQALESGVASKLSIETALHTQPPGALDGVKEEISALAQALMRETETAMGKVVLQAAQVFESKLEGALQQQVNQMQAQEHQLAGRLGEAVREHMAAAVKEVAAQGVESREALLMEFRDLGDRLMQRPEIAIRYPGKNGSDPKHHRQEVNV